MPISVQVLTRELADRLKLSGRTGVRVTRVFGGAAEPSELKVGDVITALDGNPLEASQPSDADLFATLIRQYKIGSTAKLTIVRDGKPMDVAVTLDTSPRLPREMKKYEDPSFEFRVRDIAAADRVVDAASGQISPACSSMRSARAAGRRSATSPTATCC